MTEKKHAWLDHARRVLRWGSHGGAFLIVTLVADPGLGCAKGRRVIAEQQARADERPAESRSQRLASCGPRSVSRRAPDFFLYESGSSLPRFECQRNGQWQVVRDGTHRLTSTP